MWATVRLIITLAMIKEWYLRQLDFVLAYPQAEVDGDIYMKLPKGFELPGNHGKGKHFLKLLKDMYRLKQARRVWSLHLHKGLLKLNHTQSNGYPCLYYPRDTLIAVYRDDCILIDKNRNIGSGRSQVNGRKL